MTVYLPKLLTDALLWAEHLAKPYKDGVDLWVALGTLLTALFTLTLAAGTVYLALKTSESVRIANDVAQGEDRRHQQSLAPIVVIDPILDDSGDTLLGFAVRNVGLGPAQNAVLMMKGRRFDSNPSEGELVEPFFRSKTILEAQSESPWTLKVRDILEFGNADLPKSDAQLAVLISYFDLFSNEYRTISEDPLEPAEMAWLRPKELYSQQTTLERYLGTHADAPELFDFLKPTRTVATVGFAGDEE